MKAQLGNIFKNKRKVVKMDDLMIRISDMFTSPRNIVLMIYGEFIKWVAFKTNATNIFIGMYCDGEPFCSGNFGEISYMGYLKYRESK